MKTETYLNTPSDSIELNGTINLDGAVAQLDKVAKTLHEVVNKIESKIETGANKVMNLQQEYTDVARDQVRSNPLAAIGAAFVVGFVVAKVITR